MGGSRSLGGARSRVLLLCATLFFTVGWVDSGVTPGTLGKTTLKIRHADGILRLNDKTVWLPRNDSCYQYITNLVSWGDAETHCQRLAQGSHLASAHSKEDNEYMQNFAYWHTHHHHAFWIGASDLYMKRHYVWTDASPLNFTNWHPEEPFSSGGKEHCVCSNYKSPGLWGEVKCESNLPFICKVPIIPKNHLLCWKGGI
ncbi:lectin-like [Lissotriton helveticus]